MVFSLSGLRNSEQRVEKVNDHTIQGWMRCTPDGGGWGDGYGNANYTVYFYCQFEKPLEKYGVWSVDVPAGLDRKNRLNEDPEWQKQVAAAKVMPMCSEAEGKHLGFYTEFATQAGEQVLMKCGIWNKNCRIGISKKYAKRLGNHGIRLYHVSK